MIGDAKTRMRSRTHRTFVLAFRVNFQDFMQTDSHPTGLARALRYVASEWRYRQIFRKFRNFTMIPRVSYTANLRLAATVRNVSGDIVECGTWRGGMIAGIADVLGPNRNYRLFDSYEGMPPAKEIDGPLALAWERQQGIATLGYHNHARASEQEAEAAMKLSRTRHFKITKGWFEETLPQTPRMPIALLRLDGDWYDSTICALENLAPCVTSGGLIIVDDYYLFDGCTRAVNEYAAAHNWRIHESRFGEVCYVRIF